jgi:hypothetical protein
MAAAVPSATRFWLNLQGQHDLAVTACKVDPRLGKGLRSPWPGDEPG